MDGFVLIIEYSGLILEFDLPPLRSPVPQSPATPLPCPALSIVESFSTVLSRDLTVRRGSETPEQEQTIRLSQTQTPDPASMRIDAGGAE